MTDNTAQIKKPIPAEISAMKPFVKAVEVWTPNTKYMVLELASAYYGDLGDFKKTSESMDFAFGQGLPGRTWATGQAIVLNDFDDSEFLRSKAVKHADIACAISIPIFCGEFLQAVVVLFCGGGNDVAGAMEVWHNANSSKNELSLLDGYYGELEKFEWISRRLTILKGRGLPGTTWELGGPVIDDDLAHSNTFLRASHAAEAGITTGFAFPFYNTGQDIQILALLSAQGTPIARKFEIWKPNDDKSFLRFEAGQCSSATDLGNEYKTSQIKKGDGPLGECWLTGRPLVTNAKPGTGYAMIVLPIIKDCILNSIVCLVL